MRKFNVVYMRGGTSKGCIFHKEDLPENRAEWDDIFVQVMGSPDPKQIDGMGGTVSSNNKIVIVWKSDEPNVDIEYLVGQSIVGKSQIDYKSNCGNMTAAVPAYAVEEGMVDITEPITVVRMLNKNTDKYINVSVPIDPETHTFAQDGDCHIAGIDGTAAELKVNFLNPAGAKTGKLLPTGYVTDTFEIGGKQIVYSLVDVSNPLILEAWKDMGATPTPFSFSELYTALQQKTVDAQENPIELIYSQKFYEQQKYITLTNHLQQTQQWLVSQKFYDSLSDDDKKILDKAIQDACAAATNYALDNEAKWSSEIEKYGCTFVKLTPEEQKAFKDRVKPEWDKIKAQVSPDVWDAYTKKM